MKNTKGFIGVYAHDQLPNIKMNSGSAIINYNNHDQGGSHWIAVYNHEFFDSFGIVPSDINQEWMRKSFNVKEGDIKYSSTQIQNNSSVMCGFYCIYYIKARQQGISQYDIIHNTFGFNTKENEEKLLSVL